MKLYEIAEIYQIALQSSVDPETGEISEQALARLDQIGHDIEDKAKNLAAHIGNLDADINAMREAERKIAERRKRVEREKEGFIEYLHTNMERCGISAIFCPEFDIKLKKCPPSVEVLNESKLPVQYFRQVIEVDKIAIAKTLKEGREVPGARLVTDKTRVEIK